MGGLTIKRLAILALAVVATLMAPTTSHAIDGDRYGEVHFLTPPQAERGLVSVAERGLVIMFSDSEGWNQADRAAASTLANAGALVAGVDSRYYLERLNEIDETCHVLIGDVEGLSRQLQRLHGSGDYHFPILFGVGEGGALAAAALRQAPANTIGGVVSIDPALDVWTTRPPCTNPATTNRGAAHQAPHDLQGFWTAAFHTVDTQVATWTTRQTLTEWAAAGTAVEVKDLSPDIDESQAVSMFVATRLAAPPADTVANLPLVELPAAISTDRMAIMLSGDGGWRDIDKTVADDLQSRGVSVVGWDCLRYFWHSKTPDDVAHDLAAVIETYSARWHPKHIALIGYSFGADVLPFAFNRLPEALRSKITLMSLLAFSKSADFEISVTGWLGAPPTAAALPVADEVNHVPASLVQCFYGETEDDSDCPDLASRGMEVIRTQGGHHFDRNYEALTDRIMSGLTRRGG